jgi:hypothetical protein
MSNTLTTNKFRKHVGQQITESFNEPANNAYYLVSVKHTPYSNTDGDTYIPIAYDNISETNTKIYQEAIFGKKILSSDTSLMIPRKNWTSGTVYYAYDDTANNLFTSDFYASVDSGATYYVYKCLDNNFGATSTEQPSSTSESACNFITTADGYTWKLMYKLTEGVFEKFATDDYMPVETSANVSGNTVAGAIDVIKITYTGSDYISSFSGQFQADDVRTLIPTITGNTTTYRLGTSASVSSDFYVGSAIYISSGAGNGQIRNIVDYQPATRVITVNTAFTTPPDSTSEYLIAPKVTITGDGGGAEAYATVSSNSSVNNYISRVNMVSRGQGYTYATATITGNTGGVSNTATARAIIPPAGGHGTDAPAELGCNSVGFSVSFTTNESNYISTENDYRKVAILKDPLFDKVTFGVNNAIRTFTTGETISQIEYKTLTGTIAGNLTSTTIVGTGTEFSSLKANDYIIITDPVTTYVDIRQVSSVTNNTQMTVSANLSFNTSYGTLAHTDILCTAVKIGNTNPYVTCSNVEPKFTTNKYVIGMTSGAFGLVANIHLQDGKSFNSFNFFDNRTRIAYNSGSSTGTIPEDATVYQTDISLSNAYMHSANSTYVYITSEKGPINADPASPLLMSGGSNSYVLESTKYTSDIVKQSGDVLYIESNSPISRSDSQSETYRMIFKF